jgi:malate dehydrogenase (oxaloacetate-decarboxylating)(NADP+)
MKTATEEKTRVLGVDLLWDPHLNKGTAFSARERRRLKLEGLLPPVVEEIVEQVQRVMNHIYLHDRSVGS